MANSRGRSIENKYARIDMMETAYAEGKLVKDIAGVNYLLFDSDDTLLAMMQIDSGEYQLSTAGQHKSNKRSYIEIKGMMFNAHDFKLIADGIFARYNKERTRENGIIASKYLSYIDGESKEVNHINGNTLDNRTENLEVVTRALNMAHARLMAEVEVYFPNLVTHDVDCQGNKMHTWVDGKGVSCRQIEDWNREHSLQIKSFKSKKDPVTNQVIWQSKYSMSDIIRMLQYFGIM